MNRIIAVIAAVAIGFTLAATRPAAAGTQLQLQFQRWAYEGGYVRLLVSLRNPTMKPFSRVVWNCDFHDKEQRLIGRGSLVFSVVPWGGVVVSSQTVVSNGMFEGGDCQLVVAEPVTYENERLYRSRDRNIGLADPEADTWFSLDSRIQGRAVIHSQEDDERLAQEHKAGRLTGPGYRSMR